MHREVLSHLRTCFCVRVQKDTLPFIKSECSSSLTGQPIRWNREVEPTDTLLYRKSSGKGPAIEAMEGTDLKKRDLREARTSHVVAPAAPTNTQEPGPRVSPGLDPSPDQDPDPDRSLEQLVTLTKNQRVFRMAHRAGESEKSTWAHCCQYENNGLIMSWPQYRLCLHNRCDCCEYSEDLSDAEDERAEERVTSSRRFHTFHGLFWFSSS